MVIKKPSVFSGENTSSFLWKRNLIRNGIISLFGQEKKKSKRKQEKKRKEKKDNPELISGGGGEEDLNSRTVCMS